MGLSLKNHQSMTLTMTFRSERLVYLRLLPDAVVLVSFRN